LKAVDKKRKFERTVNNIGSRKRSYKNEFYVNINEA
jgi:hypothetical protein